MADLDKVEYRGGKMHGYKTKSGTAEGMLYRGWMADLKKVEYSGRGRRVQKSGTAEGMLYTL